MAARVFSTSSVCSLWVRERSQLAAVPFMETDCRVSAIPSLLGSGMETPCFGMHHSIGAPHFD